MVDDFAFLNISVSLMQNLKTFHQTRVMMVAEQETEDWELLELFVRPHSCALGVDKDCKF